MSIYDQIDDPKVLQLEINRLNRIIDDLSKQLRINRKHDYDNNEASVKLERIIGILGLHET